MQFEDHIFCDFRKIFPDFPSSSEEQSGTVVSFNSWWIYFHKNLHILTNVVETYTTLWSLQWHFHMIVFLCLYLVQYLHFQLCFSSSLSFSVGVKCCQKKGCNEQCISYLNTFLTDKIKTDNYQWKFGQSQRIFNYCTFAVFMHRFCVL
jgi:hypothetical protein